MSEKLIAKHPVYPLISLASAVLILATALVNAKSSGCIWFLAGVWVLFFCFGYRKACAAVLPFAALFCLILAGLTWLISKDPALTAAAANRILGFCLAVIPGLGMRPSRMVQSFSSLGMPRMITLAMMITLTFFPLFFLEVRQIREAMRTRGAAGIWNPSIFYRAFLIPLMMRLIGISDTLALSVETRGFSAEGEHTQYKTVPLRAADFLFLGILLAGVILTFISR